MSFNATDTDNRLKIAPVFRRNVRPKPDTPDLMMTIPPELRNRIYHLVLSAAACHSHTLPCKEPELLRTSQQIRSESAPIFYGNRAFYVVGRLDLPTFGVSIKPIPDIVRECGTQPFRDFLIRMAGAIWPHLDSLLPFLEIVRATGFEPATKEYVPGVRESYLDFALREKTRHPLGKDSIFIMSNMDHGGLEEVLERAVSLGRKARDEGWTKEELAKEFRAFVKRKGKEPKPLKGKRSKAKREGGLEA